MAQQKVVSTYSDGQEEQLHETEAVFYQYVFDRARNDCALNPEASRSFEEASQSAVVQEREAEATPAATVGRRLAELGDEIDAQYQEEMKEIVQLAGSPETAFSSFHDVVKNLFEWDEQGGARINVGRIAALLAYCYHLCKTYISQNLAAGSLVSFLAMVATWLFKFLIKAKFYEWLEKQGGWAQMLTSALPTSWNRNMFLFIGVASLAVWVYSYFKGR